MVAVNGENTAERPMWTEKGGLDFEGRAKWDAWAAVKGMKPEKAKLEFVRVRTCIRNLSPLGGTMSFQFIYQKETGGSVLQCAPVWSADAQIMKFVSQSLYQRKGPTRV